MKFGHRYRCPVHVPPSLGLEKLHFTLAASLQDELLRNTNPDLLSARSRASSTTSIESTRVSARLRHRISPVLSRSTHHSRNSVALLSPQAHIWFTFLASFSQLLSASSLTAAAPRLEHCTGARHYSTKYLFSFFILTPPSILSDVHNHDIDTAQTGSSADGLFAFAPPSVQIPGAPPVQTAHQDDVDNVDIESENILSTRIWAHEFAWSPSPHYVGCVTTTTEPADMVEMENFTKSRMVVDKMAGLTKTMIIEAKVILTQPRVRFWDGIFDPRLTAIRAKPDLNKVRDQLIVGLDRNDSFTLYFSVPRSAANLKKRTVDLNNYFSKLLMITKQHGHFWFMRRQTEREGLGLDAIEKPALPETKFVTPRFLGNMWTAIKVTEPNGSIWFKKIAIYKYAPLYFPQSYEDANEAAFLLKLAVREDSKTQARNLSELVQSDGSGKFFKARFHTVGQTKGFFQYRVEIYLGLERQMALGNIKIPGPGTRIALVVDRFNQSPPVKRDSFTVRATVVAEAIDTDASFVCIIDSTWKLTSVSLPSPL